MNLFNFIKKQNKNITVPSHQPVKTAQEHIDNKNKDAITYTLSDFTPEFLDKIDNAGIMWEDECCKALSKSDREDVLLIDSPSYGSCFYIYYKNVVEFRNNKCCNQQICILKSPWKLYLLNDEISNKIIKKVFEYLRGVGINAFWEPGHPTLLSLIELHSDTITKD